MVGYNRCKWWNLCIIAKDESTDLSSRGQMTNQEMKDEKGKIGCWVHSILNKPLYNGLFFCRFLYYCSIIK